MSDWRDNMSVSVFLVIAVAIGVVCAVACAFVPEPWHESIVTAGAVIATFIAGGFVALGHRD